MKFYSSNGKIDTHNTFVWFYILKTSAVRRLMISSLNSTQNSYIDTPKDFIGQ